MAGITFTPYKYYSKERALSNFTITHILNPSTLSTYSLDNNNPDADKEVLPNEANLTNFSNLEKRSLIGMLFIDKPQIYDMLTNVVSGFWGKPQEFHCEIVTNKVVYYFYLI